MNQQTSNRNNPFIELFASVQLALMLLFLLAATSIIGTLIPQNQPQAFYIQEYGLRWARFLHLLDVDDMYNSWWFLGLLALFSLNLVVCSFKRIPQVIRMIRRDPLTVTAQQLKKYPLVKEVLLTLPFAEATAKVESVLAGCGWPGLGEDRDQGRLYAGQKGAWTRLGVYLVHLSILVILAGAILGSGTVGRTLLGRPNFAFKGSVMLPEGESTDAITTFKGGERVPLGFTLRCDRFTIDYYPNGMPKIYQSKVTVLENGQAVRTEEIEVNRPLTHRGVTFYQSSYQPYGSYLLNLSKKGSGESISERIVPAQEMSWAKQGVSYGIINRESQGEATRRLKIWFFDGQDEPSTFWVRIGQEAAIERPTGTYLLSIRQMYATGLQATKDPGVGLVYTGCLMMLIGLYTAFFLSHRRLWAWVEETEDGGCRVLLAGEANKNRPGFETKFSEILNRLEK